MTSSCNQISSSRMLGKILAILTVSTFVHHSYSVRVPPNPCPEVFQYYRSKSGNQLYGEVVIPYDGAEHMVMSLNGSFRALLPERKFTIKLTTPLKELLARSDKVVYEVYFPSQRVLPRITRVEYNGRTFCSGPQEPLVPGEEGTTNLWSSFIYRFNRPPNYIPAEIDGVDSSIIPIKGQTTSRPAYTPWQTATKPTSPWQPFTRPQTTWPAITRATTKRPIPTRPATPSPRPVPTRPTRPSPPVSTNPHSNRCGVSNALDWNILRPEEDGSAGDFPWLAAMMVYDEVVGSYGYKCSANLISEKHVVTAGRCIQYHQVQVVPTEKILLVMGTNDLANWATNGAVSRKAKKVHVHPEFKKNFKSANADVALITLDSSITPSDKIRPVCMWKDEDVNITPFVNKMGIVVGYQADSSNGVSVPKSTGVQMPIVPPLDCLTQDGLSGNVLSEKTFCAGDTSGTTACQSDSGSGLVFSLGGIYYLRGIESLTVMKDNQCDRNSYSIFCDVAKFNDWIRKSMYENLIILKHLDD